MDINTSLFPPPKPRLLQHQRNVYEYLFTDFQPINQVHISSDVIQRAANLHHLEETLNFKLINNDHTKQSLLSLLGIRNLISGCLANMPSNYVTSIVYNSSHHSIGAYQKDGSLVACVTFRAFPQQDFAELVFCVVKAESQVHGIGASLMDHFKQYLQALCIHHILVFADNSAIGFFERQGYNFTIPMDSQNYEYLIKYYDGATLMHCDVIDEYDYVRRHDLSEAMQKIIVASMTQQEVLKFTEYPITELNGINIKPVIEAPLSELIQTIFDRAVSESSAHLFMKLVPKSDNPDYYRAIKKPMCFENIRERIQNGRYKNIDKFLDDIFQIITNAYSYNELESKYVQSASVLENHIRVILGELNIDYRPK
ncbi:Histone acetyltransferase gcn5 [Tritrichomonas foetus]|uniref:histone acetyltransferase n=1 Tax=Tritrichomonas foetus TaxID=1144522 RepID=A0A1J4KZS6_9EUKA|nr:Histone acetyltransferase gcn5 [Tritrichomonas foetus]|eukprot:OHT15196.1 Histone acetyltransferase gcn5 [Tritrichomonas foetus]